MIVDSVAKQKKILKVLEEAYETFQGNENLTGLLDRFYPFEAAEWIFKALESNAVKKRSKKKAVREQSPATVVEEIAKQASAYAKKPSVILGSRFGLLAGMLGIELGVDADAARVALAKKAWTETSFIVGDPFVWEPDKKYRFFLLNRLCRNLPRKNGFLAYRELLERIKASSLKKAHLLIVDELRFQDDLIELLARGNCEILDLATLADQTSVAITATIEVP